MGLFWDQVPFMNLLWVVEHWRGQGIGTTLVKAWEKAHLAHGHTLVLTSTSSAERAQHLYRRLGYVDSGSLLLPQEPTELILRKLLARQPINSLRCSLSTPGVREDLRFCV